MGRLKTKGFSLLEVIFALSIFSVAFLALASLLDFINISTTQSNQKDNITEIRQSLILTLQNKKAWNNSLNTAVKDGSSLSCLFNGTCTVESNGDFEKNGSFKLMDSNNKLIYDGTSPISGFDIKGQPCSSYGVVGETQCIYRYILNWAVLCPTSGGCSNPGVNIRAQFVTNEGSNHPIFNAEQLNFEIYLTSDVQGSPIAMSDSFYLMKNTNLANIPILSNDYGPNGNTSSLTVTWVGIHDPNDSTIKYDNKTWASQFRGTTGINISIDSGNTTVSYNASSAKTSKGLDFNGLDFFEYTALDQATGKTSTGKVWIKVMTTYTWTGDAGDGLWNTRANWCGSISSDNKKCIGAATLPTATSDIYFDDTCNNCDITNTSSINVNSISLNYLGKFGFFGKFTQAGPITVGAGGFYQDSGVFLGNMSDITVRGDFEVALKNDPTQFWLSEGKFTSTSGVLTLQGNIKISSSQLSFPASGQTVIAKLIANTNIESNENVLFNNLTLSSALGIAGVDTIVEDSLSTPKKKLITVGTLIVAIPGGRYSNYTGRVYGHGNIHSNSQMENLTVVAAGNSDQTISYTGGGGVTGWNGAATSSFEIASTGGTVYLVGTQFFSYNFIYVSGVVDTSAIGVTYFRTPYSSKPVSLDTGPILFRDVYLEGAAAGCTTLKSPLIVKGNLYLSPPVANSLGPGLHCFSSGPSSVPVLAHGDIEYAVNQISNTTRLKIKIVGNSNQTIRSKGMIYPSTSDRNGSADFEIASTGGVVSFPGDQYFSGDFIYTSGNVDVSGSRIVFNGQYSAPLTISSGPIQFEDLILGGGAGPIINLTSPLIVKGKFQVLCGNYLGTGNPGCRAYHSGPGGVYPILAYGDVDFGGINQITQNSRLKVKLVGNSNQNISTNYTYPNKLCYSGSPDVEIVSTGGTVRFLTDQIFSGDFIYTSGTVDISSVTTQFNGTYSLSAKINSGPIIFGNVGLSGGAGVSTLESSMNINGNLEFWGGHVCNVGTRQFISGAAGVSPLVSGNVSFYMDQIGILPASQRVNVKLVGSGPQSVSSALTLSDYNVGSTDIEFASTGTVTLSDNLILSGNIKYSSGTVSSTGTVYRQLYNNSHFLQSGAISFNNLIINGNYTELLTDPLNVLGNLTINANKLDMNGKMLTVGGTLTINSGKTLKTGGGIYSPNSSPRLVNYGTISP